MFVNYVPDKGLKLTGSEVGAWLNDSINNDSRLIITDGWTAYPGSNVITFEKDLARFDFTNNYEWIGISVPFTTIIGKSYSVLGQFFSPGDMDGVTDAGKFGISTFAAANTPTKSFQAASVVNISNTAYIVTFTAAQTLYYIHWSMALDASKRSSPFATVSTTVEIRDAKQIGGHDSVELNTLNNAISDNSGEANNLNGFTQIGLDQGANVFQTVTDLSPELHTYANAASDPNGNEANATTGFSSGNNGVISSVSSPVFVGLYAISVESNTTPQNGGGCFLDMLGAGISLTVGVSYTVSVDLRHNGIGGMYSVYFSDSSAGVVNQFITDLFSTDTNYNTFSVSFVYDNDHRFFVARENSATNDGGAYIDNLSITEVKVNVGTYAIQAESNDTPTLGAVCYIDMEASFGLVLGALYSLSVDVKHVGVGSGWRVNASTNIDPDTGISIDIVRNLTDVNYQTYSIIWMYNGERYLGFSEDSASNDGGVYFDNLRVHEAGELFIYSNAASDPAGLESDSTIGFFASNNAIVSSVPTPTDKGSYAISAESNTTPTLNARVYVNLTDSILSLTVGTTYLISFSARHIGIGGNWSINLAGNNFGKDTQIVLLTSVDVTYIQYSLAFTMESLTSGLTRSLVLIEESPGNDGGVYIDNISIREAVGDLSASNKGLAIYGDIHAGMVNFNADTIAYDNFSALNYFLYPYDPILDFGTGDFYYMLWFKSSQKAVAEVLLQRVSGGTYVGVVIDVSGTTRLQTGSGDVNSLRLVDSNNWHFGVYQRASGVGQVWIDGTLDNAVNNTHNIIIPNEPMYVGVNVNKNNPSKETAIASLRFGNFSLSEKLITEIYNSEKILFQQNSAYSQVDVPIDLDIITRDVNRSVEATRNRNVSLGGQTETLFNRQNNFWNTTTTTIDGPNLKYHQQFFDSAVNGQTFTFDPYGTIAAPVDPKQVILENNKYTEGRQGQLDKFRIDFKVKE